MDDQLKQIAQQVRARQFADARTALRSYLQAHPGSAPAWYMLSFAAATSQKKLAAARRAAKLDASRPQFAARLKALQSRPKRRAGLPAWVPFAGAAIAVALLVALGAFAYYFTAGPILQGFALVVEASPTAPAIPTDVAPAQPSPTSTAAGGSSFSQNPAPAVEKEEAAALPAETATEVSTADGSPPQSTSEAAASPTTGPGATPTPVSGGPSATPPRPTATASQTPPPTDDGSTPIPPGTAGPTITPFPTPTTPTDVTPPPQAAGAVPIGIKREIGTLGQMRVIAATRPGDSLMAEMGGTGRKPPAGESWIVVELLFVCKTSQACASPPSQFEVIGVSGRLFPSDSTFNMTPMFTASSAVGGQIWGYRGFVVPNSEAQAWLIVTSGSNTYAFALQ